jgi:hypothetical protein
LQAFVNGSTSLLFHGTDYNCKKFMIHASYLKVCLYGCKMEEQAGVLELC